MKVQCLDALVEAVEVGLSQQLVQGSASGGWVSRRRSTNHSFSGQRGATRVMERLGVSLTLATTRPTSGKGGNAYMSRLSQGWRNASTKTAWGSGTREQYRGSFALRRVTNKSNDGSPKSVVERLPPVVGETTLSL